MCGWAWLLVFQFNNPFRSSKKIFGKHLEYFLLHFVSVFGSALFQTGDNVFVLRDVISVTHFQIKSNFSSKKKRPTVGFETRFCREAANVKYGNV